MSVTQSWTDFVAPAYEHSIGPAEGLRAVDTTSDVVDIIQVLQERASVWERLRKYGPLFFSATLHMSILIVMAFCMFPVTRSSQLALTAVLEEGTGEALDELPGQYAQSLPPIEFDISAPVWEPNSAPAGVDITLIRPERHTTVERQRWSPSAILPDTTVGTSLVVHSIAEAADRVTGGIQGKLQRGDLLVVWLLDTTLSMAGDRQRLAERLKAFLKDSVDGAALQHKLLNAVVVFGAAAREHVASTESRGVLLDSLDELPIDTSGKEHVFAAIEQCATRYRRDWREKQLLIVVVTDESGDDVSRLENTIRICREQNVSVSVVGPPAVLGAETAFYSFHDSQSGQLHQLPITRGPDSALPERLELGYWFVTQEPRSELGSIGGFGEADLPSWYGDDAKNIPGHRCVVATEVGLPPWFGGRDLRGLMSGFSPYGLTRLASETNGTYITLQRDGECGPFSANAMRSYASDYRSVDDYLDDVYSHPLRRAVMEAVAVTQGKNVGPPPTMLFGKLSESPPFGFMRTYFTPARFASHLRESRRGLEREADRMTRIVDQALSHLSDGVSLDDGLEDEYEREPLPRWRAWYDLTRGRLLAASVRLEEYRLACERVVEPGFLNETTNHLILVPSPELRSASVFHRRAEEAERLLTRCVRENPKTPWAWLAQRELDYHLGIDVHQHRLERVRMPPGSARPFRPPKL